MLDNSHQRIPIKTAGISLARGKPASVKYKKQGVVTGVFKKKNMDNNLSMLLKITDSDNKIYGKYFALSTGKEDYDITFYPEGGYLLTGTACRVAFKALDRSGNSLYVKISLLDDNGNTILTDSTFHCGMGSFSFTPKAGQHYRVWATNKQGLSKLFELPEPQNSAHALSITDFKDKLQISILAAQNAPDEKLFLLLHLRGAVLYAGWVDGNNGRAVELVKGLYPLGLVQCLLLDKQMNPVSERLCFIANRLTPNCTFETDKAVYGKKEHITATITLTDRQGNPVKGNLSVAITDQALGVADTSHSIQSTLLLTSELRGRIETPSFYFSENERAPKALDLLLMTQRWRRYRLAEIIKGKMDTARLLPERYFSLSGKLESKKPFKDGETGIVKVSNLYIGLNKTLRTRPDGTFDLDSLEFEEGTPIGVTGLKKNQNSSLPAYGKKKFNIEIKKDTFPIKPFSMPQALIAKQTCMRDKTILPVVAYYAGFRHFFLNQVTVKPSYPGSENDRELDKQDIAKLNCSNAWELLDYLGIKMGNNEAGILSGTYKNQMVDPNIESGSINWAMFNYFSLSDFQTINFYRVDEVTYDLLSFIVSPTKEYYRNTNVYILDIKLNPAFDLHQLELMYHWSFYENTIYSKIRTDIYPLGYQAPVEFYAPRYENTSPEEIPPPDFRPTIFWKPDIQTDSTGRAEFSFYSSDSPGNYTVVIEGLTEKGEIIYTVKKINIR
ncbi:MAG: hypothetical protein COC06_12340 [Bacteroidales bacterium]|nr:MAG: hypothetical protein COC06_12340 [Bacteroidales bacterium]